MRALATRLFIGVSFFLLFILFSYSIHKNIFTYIDFDTTVRLQDHVSRRLDVFFSFFSVVGSFEVAGVFLIIFLISLRRVKGIIIFMLFGFIHVIELYGKTFLHHYPPPHFLLRTLHPLDFPKFYIREEFSYPSGHAARAMFLSVLLFFFLRKKKNLSPYIRISIIGSLVLYDGIMLMSRVYLGEHWTSDVIGGAMLGISLACIASLFL